MLVRWLIVLFAKGHFQHTYMNAIIHQSSDLESLKNALNSNKSALDCCTELMEDIIRYFQLCMHFLGHNFM